MGLGGYCVLPVRWLPVSSSALRRCTQMSCLLYQTFTGCWRADTHWLAKSPPAAGQPTLAVKKSSSRRHCPLPPLPPCSSSCFTFLCFYLPFFSTKNTPFSWAECFTHFKICLCFPIPTSLSLWTGCLSACSRLLSVSNNWDSELT